MSFHIRPTSYYRTSFVCDACVKQSQRSAVHRAASRLQRNAAFSTRAATSKTKYSPSSAHPAFRISPSVPVEAKRFHRSHSTTATATAIAPANAGLAPIHSRRLISLSGPDAAKFLQGLITNNVSPDRHTPFYAAFLDARGRVLWDVFVWVYPDLVAREGGWACYIEVDGGEVDAMLKHLKRHKLRSKIAIKLVEKSEMGVWAAWGVQPEQLPQDRLIASLADPRGFSTEDFGTRCLLQGIEAPSNAPVPVVEERQYHLRRYMAGIPEGALEIPRESALPMEWNIDLSHGIDFRKGCYVGQELTIRTKHTGVVRKRILPVQLYTGPSSGALSARPDSETSVSTPPFNADIKQIDEDGSIKKGRAAGKFISSIGNVGLAVCRLEMMTSMRISAEGGSWKPGIEFGIQMQKDDGSDEVVRVKPVVSQRFRERERDLWDKARTRV